MKWHFDNVTAFRYIVARRYSPNIGEYEEDWILPGVQFTVRFQESFPLTDSGRIFGITFGENIGGYIGVSLGFDGSYHVGTPAHARSLKLIMAIEKVMMEEEKSTETEELPSLPEEKEKFLWHVAEAVRKIEQQRKEGKK
jgi:hypothetical protein